MESKRNLSMESVSTKSINSPYIPYQLKVSMEIQKHPLRLNTKEELLSFQILQEMLIREVLLKKQRLQIHIQLPHLSLKQIPAE